MDKEESWQQFWNSGKVEDYLIYSRCEENKEHTEQGKTEGGNTDLSEKERDYFL